MLLSEAFDERFASTALLGANGKTSDFGKVFASNSYVGFYFHHETPNLAADGISSIVQQPCQQFLEQARTLVDNLQGSNGGESNAKKPKSSSGRGDNFGLAIVLVSAPQPIKGESIPKYGCIAERDLRDDFAWILPIKEQQAMTLLLRIYKVRSTPTFIIVDARTKQTIASDGRRALQADPQGRRFPWHLPEASDVFRGQLIKKPGIGSDTELIDVNDLRNSIKCLLFAAHWCPPCRSFVKQLIQTYQQLKENQSTTNVQFEIIFCSMDRCEDSFRQFYADMPWMAFPYSDPRCIAASRLYNVQEIPTLIVLDADNQLITRHGKCELTVDPAGKEFPWYPKVILELNSYTANRLREDLSFLLFTEGASEDLVFAQTSLLPVAEEFCLRSGSDQQDMLFFYCGEDPICDQIWDNLSLGDASLPLICVIDPFTDSLYVCDDPNVSEAIIRRFIEKFFSGDLEPTRYLSSFPTMPNSRGNVVLNSPQQPNINFPGSDSNAKVLSERDNPGMDQSLSGSSGAKRLCVNVGGVENLSSQQQRYCL